jgi:prolyl oligopeptidase
MRERAEGKDELLVDPAPRGNHTSVKPISVSSNGHLLLYEVKVGGERTGTFEFLDLNQRKTLPDVLPRGYLRGLAFAADAKSVYYVHESTETPNHAHIAYQHVFGTPIADDRELFAADANTNIRLGLASDGGYLLIYVHHLLDRVLTDVHVRPLDASEPFERIFHELDYTVALRFTPHGVFALTDLHAPNRRLVQVHLHKGGKHEYVDIVPESETAIHNCQIVGDRIFIFYLRHSAQRICIFDLSGKEKGELSVRSDETMRIIGRSSDGDELLFETESFVEPVRTFRYSVENNERRLWARREIPFDSASYSHSQTWYTSKDGTRIPMFLVGRLDVLEKTNAPVIMTAYGGYGIAMTPQFSVFVAFLMERGCLFALPNIRGGSEFGSEWHMAAMRRNRQTAYDDFLSAAEWLIGTGRADPKKLAIFGGSNSGLLVGAALTQRPELFRAVLCMVPMLDMFRYHLFDNAQVWKDELGTADDPEDFAALAKYSPYHHVRDGVAYPATMLVSGDQDRNCNSLHARKMTARLQAASISGLPVILDYNPFRGHSPVLPLTDRVEALTDRMAFLCDQLELSI